MRPELAPKYTDGARTQYKGTGLGMTVARAVDGKQAVALFASNPANTFDVILMDIMMPRMDGYEAAKAIRSLENRPDGAVIPIITIAANAGVNDSNTPVILPCEINA